MTKLGRRPEGKGVTGAGAKDATPTLRHRLALTGYGKPIFPGCSGAIDFSTLAPAALMDPVFTGGCSNTQRVAAVQLCRPGARHIGTGLTFLDLAVDTLEHSSL